MIYIFLGIYLVGVFVGYGLSYGTSEKAFHWRGNFWLSIMFSLTSWISVLVDILHPEGFGKGLGFKLIPDFSPDYIVHD